MNFNINDLSFAAKYTVYGKNTPQMTNCAYGAKIKQLKTNRALATEAQAYLLTPRMQNKIAMLPNDTFVRLHTAVYTDDDGNDEFLNFTPYISFETKRINEQIELEKACGADCSTLKLSLDKDSSLDKKAINAWFNNLIDFYA